MKMNLKKILVTAFAAVTLSSCGLNSDEAKKFDQEAAVEAGKYGLEIISPTDRATFQFGQRSGNYTARAKGDTTAEMIKVRFHKNSETDKGLQFTGTVRP